MPFRGAVELESTLNARLFHVLNNRILGENVEQRLRAISEAAIKSTLYELAGSNMIPASLIKMEISGWVQMMADLANNDGVFNALAQPQFQPNLKKMSEEIFQGFTPQRIPTSPFIRPGVGFQGVRSTRTIRDETLALELEERGLKEIILPKTGAIKTEGRKRIGEGVQRSLADMEEKRNQQMEEQRKRDREEKEIADTGFGRKVDLD